MVWITKIMALSIPLELRGFNTLRCWDGGKEWGWTMDGKKEERGSLSVLTLWDIRHT